MTQDMTWNKTMISIWVTTKEKKDIEERRFKLKDRKFMLFMRTPFYYFLLITAQRSTVSN